MSAPKHTTAWRVEIYWISSIVGHLTGWIRAEDGEGEKLFRSEPAARAYARQMTGVPSPFVPFMSRRGVVVETTRKVDWIDRVGAVLAQSTRKATA